MLKRFLAGWRNQAPNNAGRPVYFPLASKARAIDNEHRYPPFARGLPVKEPRELLADYRELVESIQQTLGFNRDDFGRLIMPALDRYAAYVQLLPASERHHHRLAGGLLRHGLEVAFWAARSAEGVVFAGAGTPLERKQLEPRWRTAVCIAALLHDLGKAIHDVHVTSADGKKEWNWRTSLYDWARTNKVERYFLHWTPNRHHRHESVSSYFADRVIGTEDLYEWLTEPGFFILASMIAAISGTASPDDRVAKLVNAADSESTKEDLKVDYTSQIDNPNAVPIERYVITGMKRLLERGDWTVNTPGARVWNTPHGFFVVWKRACEELHREFAKAGITGVPHDPLRLATHLLERNLAIPFDDGYALWPIAPHALDTSDGDPITLEMLKLGGPHLLYSVGGPEIVPARVMRTTVAAAAETSQQPRASSTEPPAAMEAAPPEARIVIAAPPAAASPAPSPERPSEAPAVQAEVPKAPRAAELPASPSVAAQRAPGERPASLPGRGGKFLMAMAGDIASGKRPWGNALALVGSDVIVRYPDGIADYGNAADILNALSEAGWIELDPLAPMKKVREREGVRGLVLTDVAARAVVAHAMAGAASTEASSTGEARARGRRGGKPSADEVRKVARTMVEVIRAGDPTIGHEVEADQDGEWLRVDRGIISSFARDHSLSIATLRSALQERHDVRLEPAYVLVKKHLNN